MKNHPRQFPARGLKGKKWFSLIDKVSKEGALQRAWEKVRGSAEACGVDGITIGNFEQNSRSGDSRRQIRTSGSEGGGRKPRSYLYLAMAI